MSIFTLIISFLPTSNLPWFMDLTFQVPIQYCSLQHWTLLSLPKTSTLVHYFQFGSDSLFLLELFLHFSPVAYWAPTDLGSSSLIVISFCLFIPFMGFSRQKCSCGLPFPCPVDHVSSELSTMTHSFIELNKAVIHLFSLISFLWLWFLFCLPSDGWGKVACGSFLMGGTHFSSVTQLCLTLQPHSLQHNRVPCLSLTPRVWSNLCP